MDAAGLDGQADRVAGTQPSDVLGRDLGQQRGVAQPAVQVTLPPQRFDHVERRLDRAVVVAVQIVGTHADDQLATRYFAVQEQPEALARGVTVGAGGGREVHLRRADEAGDEDVAWRGVQLVGRAHLLQPSLVGDGDAVRQGHRLDLVVGDVDHGGAEALVQFLELDPHPRAQGRVEVAQRLVEQEDLGPPDDGTAHRHPLPLAARQLLGESIQQRSQIQ